MKQYKMFERELAKIDGMKVLLEQQAFMIESTLDNLRMVRHEFRWAGVFRVVRGIKGGGADEQAAGY